MYVQCWCAQGLDWSGQIGEMCWRAQTGKVISNDFTIQLELTQWVEGKGFDYRSSHVWNLKVCSVFLINGSQRYHTGKKNVYIYMCASIYSICVWLMSLLTPPAVWSTHNDRAKIVLEKIKMERDTLELRMEPYFQVYFLTEYHQKTYLIPCITKFLFQSMSFKIQDDS